MTAYLAVARFRKPHGLKGEVVVIPVTDRPESVFTLGRLLTPLDENGDASGKPFEIVRSRPFHRQWLLQFAGVEDRSELETWPRMLLGVPEDSLEGPGEGEIYHHEIPGCEVVVNGNVVGLARELMALPSGELLAFEMDGREVLVPFKAPILCLVDRERRRIEIDPPAGLLDL